MADAHAPPPLEKKEERVSEEGDSSLLTSTLPTTQEWPMTLFRLHGFWMIQQDVESVKLVQAQFKARPDDVLLATFAKSGTTWLKAIAFTILNRSRHPIGGGDHPQLSHNPHDLVPYLEMPNRALYPIAELEAIPSPRLLSTHLPNALLPPGTLALGCRIVYLCREPKDLFVSMWHHLHSLPMLQSIDFTKAFELFCEGIFFLGPVWEHWLGYWKESLKEPSNVLFLKYDEMMDQPEKHVKMIADFLGVPFTVEEESEGLVEGVVRLCSFQNMKSLPVNSDEVTVDRFGNNFKMKNSVFFRKGKVGDWKNHLNEEMAHKLDCIIEEKLRGSGLTFSHAAA